MKFFDILCNFPCRGRQKFAVGVTKLMTPDEIRRFDGKLSQAASGRILQNHGRLPASIFRVKIASLGSLKRATGRIFKNSK